ncbi:MAG TPA: nuclear transport factor 2 family protein [Gemmatimonadaceae bacterium]
MQGTGKTAARTALIAVAIAALAQTATSQTRDERAIRAASEAWQRYIAAQQVDSIVGLFTPDAVVLFANTPPTKGSTALRSSWTDIVKLPGFRVHWTPTWVDVASPTRATEYGTYTESYDTPNGKMSDAGNYVTVWHKVKGKWRVALDAPVSTTPMPPATAALPAESSTLAVHPANSITWGDLTGPGVPPGAKIAVLSGNPGAPGEFVLRLQFPDGYQVPVHWHPTAEQVTIVSGSLGFAMGNTWDANALRIYTPGDFAYLPANHAHFALAHGPTVVQVNGMGPFVIKIGAPK